MAHNFSWYIVQQFPYQQIPSNIKIQIDKADIAVSHELTNVQ